MTTRLKLCYIRPPLPYLIVLASSVKTLKINAIDFHRILFNSTITSDLYHQNKVCKLRKGSLMQKREVDVCAYKFFQQWPTSPKNKNKCSRVNKLHPVVLQSRHIMEQKNIPLLELQGSAKYGCLANRPRNFIMVIGTWELWDMGTFICVWLCVCLCFWVCVCVEYTKPNSTVWFRCMIWISNARQYSVPTYYPSRSKWRPIFALLCENSWCS